MRTHRYHRVDVFTEHPFGGNPLAVFPDSGGLSGAEMQRVAREMNLSETVFLLEPTVAEADFRLRIFTVDRELPLAGHPVVGTVHVLATTGQISTAGRATTVMCELGVGVLPVEVLSAPEQADRVESVLMTQRVPAFGQPFADVDVLAEVLGVDPAGLGVGDLPARIVDTGVPWFLLPFRDLRALRTLAPHPGRCRELAGQLGTDLFYAFTQEVDDLNCVAHARHAWFGTATPGEDPVTGSAAACLAAYLVAESVVLAAPTADILIEQGHEVGRPGLVRALVDAQDTVVSRVRVGGSAVHIGDGELRF